MTFIAHIREADRKIQSVKEHLLEVQRLAEAYGAKIGVRYIAGLAGVLHDMGKYTDEFREYILKAAAHPDAPPKRGSVDHSTAGGKLLYERYHTGTPSQIPWLLAEVVGNAIISHHAYLHDFLDPNLESGYLKRVRDKTDLVEFEQSVERFFSNVMSESAFQDYVRQAMAELEAFLAKPAPESLEGKLMFLTKFVFSVLIDADRTSTRIFEENRSEEENEPEQNHESLFAAYYDKLIAKINAFLQQDDAQTPVNRLRHEMSEQCDRFAERPSGIYTLSIPTGGGKTLASLRYALKHALLFHKKRIIYVVPYTTIIEQNAETVRRILKDEQHILEHHSNVVEETEENDESEDGRITIRQKLKLAKDNWDVPIVFTTMVQFLNTFYGNGSRDIRRLHNLCESIIIFDEVQKVPVSCISLFNHALNFLKTYGKSSLILCTATQPALDFVKHKLDMNPDGEMIRRLDQVIDAFKRVEIIDRATNERFTTEELADFVVDKLAEVQSVLVILNTKSVVRRLYFQLKGCGVPLYHLSTSMCAAHRQRILRQVQNHLKNREKVICVSTQLIEAGVDVSFDCVIRSLAGLDSIAQAAGRCNRHGKNGIQHVYVIDHAEEILDRLKEIRRGKAITQKMLVDLRRNPALHGGHLLSRQAMTYYFQAFYKEEEADLDYPIPKLGVAMTNLLLADRKHNPFNSAYVAKHEVSIPLFIVNSYRTAAEHFRVIEDATASAIVPYGEGRRIIAELSSNLTITDLSRRLREAQPYMVNLFPFERQQLERNGGLVCLLDGNVLALRESAYHEEFGLDLDNDSGFDLSLY